MARRRTEELRLGQLDAMTLVIGAYGPRRRVSTDRARQLYQAHRDELLEHCRAADVAFEGTACYRDFEPEAPRA